MRPAHAEHVAQLVDPVAEGAVDALLAAAVALAAGHHLVGAELQQPAADLAAGPAELRVGRVAEAEDAELHAVQPVAGQLLAQ